jgi:3-methyl-2-oxobutanoate hydroxymethyltransferase
MKKQNIRKIKKSKLQNGFNPLQMLTCYDYQSAQMLNETPIDMILVGDSLGNVMLGYDTTIPVSLDEMLVFSKAVRRGAPDKFIVADLPFGTYATKKDGIKNAIKLFQQSQCEAVKLEGGHKKTLKLIRSLVETGVPVMGHLGLTPQSVHQLGGYYTHGKNKSSAELLIESAFELQKAGVFALVLECVTEDVANEITRNLSIPTIGIGSGPKTDGQVLVINDLLQMGKFTPPSFCKPMINLFELKKDLITKYCHDWNSVTENDEKPLHH